MAVAIIRPAEIHDIPDVVHVILTAVSNDQIWAKFVPSIQGQGITYIEDVTKLLKEQLMSQDWFIEVVDLESEPNAPPKIVSVAIWQRSLADEDLIYRLHKLHQPTYKTLSSYAAILQKAHAQVFSRRHPTGHTHLLLLVTHPSHKNRGHAKALVQSRIDAAAAASSSSIAGICGGTTTDLKKTPTALKARGGAERCGATAAAETGVALTAVGGPDGYIFFSGLGFRDLGLVTVAEVAYVKALSLRVETKKPKRKSLVKSLLSVMTH